MKTPNEKGANSKTLEEVSTPKMTLEELSTPKMTLEEVSTPKMTLKDVSKKKVLRVWFGDRDNVIYNTSVYFKNKYKDEWILDDFARKVIKDVDHSEVVDANLIQSPVLGSISPLQLSGGVKTLLLMKNCPKVTFNASTCGDNCAKWILELAKEHDVSICLYHVMNFGKGNFEIRILNDRKLVVHNMQEFLAAGAKYLREEK